MTIGMLALATAAWTIAVATPATGALSPVSRDTQHCVEYRIPTDWGAAACMTVAQRGVDGALQLEYTIPWEDVLDGHEPMCTPEPPGSRKHQFFAFCRDFDPRAPPPTWINQEDVDASVAAGSFDDGFVPIPEGDALIGQSEAWAGCWRRVTADDERRAIDFASADEPVVWDLGDVEAGVYTVAGYTYQPPHNVWWPQQGVVKVVDSLDPADSGPAFALTHPELAFGEYLAILHDEALELTGCVDAMAGARVTIEYALLDELDVWIPYVEDVPVSSGAFAQEFLAPEDAWGETIFLRAEIRDPMDRAFTTYLNLPLTIIYLGAPSDPTTGGVGSTGAGEDGGTDSEGDDSDGGASEGTDGTDAGAPASGGDDATGCGCASADAPRSTATLALFVLLAARRRRRLHDACVPTDTRSSSRRDQDV